jgi:hypothetical protein
MKRQRGEAHLLFVLACLLELVDLVESLGELSGGEDGVELVLEDLTPGGRGGGGGGEI